MSSTHHTAMGFSLPSGAIILGVLVLVSFIYVRGWPQALRVSTSAIPGWRRASFLIGMFLVWAALASPLVAYDHDLLTVHMIQHLLLMTFAPALILLGEPLLSLWNGLPRFGRNVLGPMFRRPFVRRSAADSFSTHSVLDCFCADASRMACAGTVYIGNAFRAVARRRAGVVFGSGVSFLVAGCSALA